jgi:hypothetical protein
MQRYGFAWNSESRDYVRAHWPSSCQLAAAASRRRPIAPHEVLAAIDRDDLEVVAFYDRALCLPWALFWRRVLRSRRVLAWLVERAPTQARLRDLCVRGSPLALRCAALVPPDAYTLYSTVEAGQLALLRELPWREHDALCYAVECRQAPIIDWLLDAAAPPLAALSAEALFAARGDAALAQRLIARFAVDDAALRRAQLLQGALQARNRPLAAALIARLGDDAARFAALDVAWYRVPQQRVFRLADRMRQDLEWWRESVAADQAVA